MTGFSGSKMMPALPGTTRIPSQKKLGGYFYCSIKSKKDGFVLTDTQYTVQNVLIAGFTANISFRLAGGDKAFDVDRRFYAGNHKENVKCKEDIKDMLAVFNYAAWGGNAVTRRKDHLL